jgi:methyl-accepting chemotaxis protein
MPNNRITPPATRSSKATGKSRPPARAITHLPTTPADDENAASFELAFSEFEAQVDAINKSMAVIEFDLDGTVLTANPNFLGVMGYTLQEVQGKHHSMFVDEDYKASAEYREFWAKLNRGENLSAECKRVAKGGKDVWIQASYNPIRDRTGRVAKVI